MDPGVTLEKTASNGDKTSLETGVATVEVTPAVAGEPTPTEFRLYKRRWFGVVAIVLFNVVSGCNGQFFGPIAVQASKDFGVSLTQMNWLSNAVNLAYLPTSFLTSWILNRIGIRNTLLLGGVHLLIATALRIAATAPKLSSGGAYALLLIAQLFVALAQPCVQIITVKYSERWFDLRGRMTSTMFTSIANPLGGVVGSLLLPALPSTNWAIYAGGIIAAALFPIGFVVGDHPPTPPTLSGSKKSQPMRHTLRALRGKTDPEDPLPMEFRDRLDFLILFVDFGILVAATGTWGNFSNQMFAPYGYTAGQAGLLGAALLGAGIVASIITAPLFDRYLSRYVGLACRLLLPVIAAGWLSVIWTIKPDNLPALFPTYAIIGVCSFILLPMSLEIAAEVTRNSETSCALLWFSANLFSFAYILIEDELREGPDADPPNNMRKATIFNAAFVVFAAVTVCLGLRAKQSRRLLDEAAAKEVQENMPEKAA